MNPTTITLYPKLIVDNVDPKIFGGFLEHIGRAVYEGIYHPTSTHSDENGYRKDVLKALQELKMPIIRYPGGNFASGYHWKNGIGPKKTRPVVRELAWQSIEPNQFGTDEFMTLCKKMKWDPMLTVNLGTGTPEEARNWVEYCNSPAGTRESNLRVENGNTETHDVKLWCLGNEMDGPWQLGHVPATQYAVKALQAAKMMKDVDNSIQLVVCGSSGPSMQTYLDWDQKVLEGLHDYADFISLHRYVGNPDNNTSDYLAVTNSIDKQIEEVDAVCRFIQGKRRSKKRTYLCFDEWNVWYKNKQMDGKGKFAPHLVEEIYNLEDALVVAGFLNSFIRHADVVKIANIAQIVNVIAPILTKEDEVLLQSIYYVFKMFSKRKTGISLKQHLEGPTYTSTNYGETNIMDSSAIYHKNELKMFLTNRHKSKPSKTIIKVQDGSITSIQKAETLTGPNEKTANSFDKPDLVTSKDISETDIILKISGGQAELELSPLSFTAITFNL
jgi:alpha-N-arabinofuranosidase